MNISLFIKEIEDSKLSLQDKLRENLVTDLQNKAISNFNERKTSLELQSSMEDNFREELYVLVTIRGNRLSYFVSLVRF